MIDLAKKYTTKGGQEVRLYEIIAEYVHGVIIVKEGKAVSTSWSVENGMCDVLEYDRSFDLVELPRKRRKISLGWINLYEDGSYGFLYESEREAREKTSADLAILARKEVIVHFREGEGI
jgi:hypothetical protein